MAAADRMTIEQVVRKVLAEDHADVIRESVRFVAQEMMGAEVSELVGAELGQRKPEDRATHRNGYRPRRSSSQTRIRREGSVNAEWVER